MAVLCRSAGMAALRSVAVRSKSLLPKPIPSSRTGLIISRSVTVLGGSESLMPLHIAIASCRLKSFIAVDSSWSWFSQDCRPLFPLNFKRSFSADIKQLPSIIDPEIEAAFKDLMAADWGEIPEGVVYDVKAALSKSTEDKAGQEALANVFRAAEASEEFGGVLVSLRMALDDRSGMSGQNVASLPTELEDALKAAYNRYMAYLDAFGHDESYLRKKVEMELGTKMVHLKMRCSGLGSEWGKITVLGTSGLSGSYVEQRA